MRFGSEERRRDEGASVLGEAEEHLVLRVLDFVESALCRESSRSHVGGHDDVVPRQDGEGRGAVVVGATEEAAPEEVLAGGVELEQEEIAAAPVRGLNRPGEEGKSEDQVLPATTTEPSDARAIAAPRSVLRPSRYVPHSSVVPSGAILPTQMSYEPGSSPGL